MTLSGSEEEFATSAGASQGVFNGNEFAGDDGDVAGSSTKVSEVEGPEVTELYVISTDEASAGSCTVHSCATAIVSGMMMLTGRAAVDTRWMIADTSARVIDADSASMDDDDPELKRWPKESDTPI
jgi:hypothetical protein